MNFNKTNDFNDEERQLVIDFENTVLKGKQQFFDIDELEIIIDYYLEVNDQVPLERAVEYAETLYPESMEIRLRRAHLLIVKQQYDDALHIIQQLRKENPDNTDIAYSLGVAYGAMGKSQKAITYYQEAAQDGWQLGRIYSNIAEEYYNMNDLEEAIRYYQLSLDTDSYDTATLYNYTDTAIQARHAEEAATYLRSFLSEHPYSAEGWHCLGRIHVALNHSDQAEDAFEYALAADKKLEEAYLDLADLQESTGQISKAVSNLRRLADINDHQADIFVMIAEMYSRNNNNAAAVDYLRQALKLEPDHVGALSNMALCHILNDDPQSALPYIKRALRLDKENPEVLYAAANIYEMLGNPDAANDFYNRMLDCEDYTEAQCHGFLAFLYRQQWYDDVIDFANESLNLFPYDWFYSTYLAAAYFRTNRYNSARRVMPNVDSLMMKEICPELAVHPLMGSLLPPDNLTGSFGQFLKNTQNQDK